MSWQDVENTVESPFMKWADAPFQVQFVGEPTLERKHFINSRPEECEGDSCRHCNDGVRLSKSFKFDVVQHPGDKEKILTLSTTAMRELWEVRNTFKDKEEFHLQIFDCSRSGTGPTTQYRFRQVQSVGDDVPF